MTCLLIISLQTKKIKDLELNLYFAAVHGTSQYTVQISVDAGVGGYQTYQRDREKVQKWHNQKS